MKLEKSRKRKFDGGGDREKFKKQKWSKNTGQSGANATPLGDRSNEAAVDSDERLPTSIPRPQKQDDRLEKDKSKWTEKKNKKKRESRNEHTDNQEKDASQPTGMEHNNEQPGGSEELADSAANQKKERFICFVGKFLSHWPNFQY